MKYEICDALPYLDDGAYFVLEPIYNTRNDKIHRLKIYLRQADGRRFEGTWGNAKKKLERLGKLEKFSVDGLQGWRLKKAQE